MTVPDGAPVRSHRGASDSANRGSSTAADRAAKDCAADSLCTRILQQSNRSQH